jgi:type IV pilus assembly protein PilM
MARTLIGLDVGTAAVRAAEVRFGRGTPALVRFGQVALPPGAVVSGEVVDAAAVSAAIKRLWREAGFKGTRVVTGVSGARVVARSADLPAMSEDDLRSSLGFQVQELIPIPLDEAILDHQVLEPMVAEDGSERMRVLVVAAHRDMVRSLLAALDGAGLQAERVDLVPFALIRALYAPDFDDLADDAGSSAEAIVDIGAGVTNVVVHEHGVPRFIRSLPGGGTDLTDAIAADLDVDFEEAEALKRRSDDDDDEATQARQIASAAMAPVLEEVRGSLDFWQAQSLDQQLRRVLVVGGTTRTDDVMRRLELVLGTPVARGSAFGRVDVTEAGLDARSLEAARSVGAVAIGLALSGEGLASGTRRISLVPKEIVERRRERTQVLAAAGAVAVFAFLLLGLYAMRSGKVDDANHRADDAEARTATLQQEVSALQDVETLQADLAARRQTVSAVLTGDVSWTRLIQQVAAVLPNDVWLTTFSGTASTPTTPGTVAFTAMGFDHTSTAHWLIRVGDLDTFAGLWVPSSTKSQGAARSLVTFSGNATLTPAANSDRITRYGGQPT